MDLTIKLPVHGSRSGNVLYTTSGREDVSKSGPIRCAAVDRSWRYVATSGEDKLLKIWEIEGLELLNERYAPYKLSSLELNFTGSSVGSSELPKRPTAIQFTADSQKILVSDKFGDVFRQGFFGVTIPPSKLKHRIATPSILPL